MQVQFLFKFRGNKWKSCYIGLAAGLKNVFFLYFFMNYIYLFRFFGKLRIKYESKYSE